jgi:hypothetical protein
MDISFDRFTLKLSADELRRLTGILETVADDNPIHSLEKADARHFLNQMRDAAQELGDSFGSEPRELDEYLDDFACAEQPEEDILTAIRCGRIPGGGYVSSIGLHLQPAIPGVINPPDYHFDGVVRENAEEVLFDSVRVGQRWSKAE